MQKQYKLKNIVIHIIERLKKQDFLVYFRKISILEISEKEVIFGVLSGFMKDNLEAKFYNEILEAAKNENPKIEKVIFKIDSNIDNPSNTDVIDCTNFYKEVKKTKKKTETSALSQHKKISNSKSVNNRYNLNNFIV
jgi:chromosomal replication initiation ATPase DnaA